MNLTPEQVEAALAELDAQIEITNSERKTAACPQKWLYRYGLGLEAEAPSHAMRVGTLVHAGLEVLSDRLHDNDPVAGANDPKRIAAATQRACQAIEREANKVLAEGQQPGSSVIDPSRPTVDAEAVQEAVQEAKALLKRYILEYGADGGFQTVHTEITLRTNAIVPTSGRKSPRTLHAAKLDRIVTIHGQHWIAEHKTTKLSLDDWHRMHRYDPQAPTYAWIAKQELGIDVVGVCYDLIHREIPMLAHELPVTKPTKAEPNGRLYKPKEGSLPRTTAVEFEKAVLALHPEPVWQTDKDGTERVIARAGLEAVEWYRDVHEALIDRDCSGYWFRREFELFAPGAIERVGEELYYAATRIRRWREAVAPLRERIIKEAAHNGGRAGEAAVHAVALLSSQFERNPAMCRIYNRMCDLADACELGNADAVTRLKVRPRIHSELDDPDND